MTLILKLQGGSRDLEQIRRAALIIRRGGTVVFPTETVYGIGANALDASACEKVYRLKGRPRDNPLIVHVCDIEMALSVGEIPKRYLRILRRVWPAPLTVIVKARKLLPRVATAGLDTVAIRMPDNDVALSLIRESRVPIAAPSANASGMPSSTRPWHAARYFSGKADAIIDSAPSRFGIESTVIDLRSFSLMRPGSYTVQQVERAFGRRLRLNCRSPNQDSRPISPGRKYRHYSPSKPLFLFTGDIRRLPGAVSGLGRIKFAFIGSSGSCRVMGPYAAEVVDLGSRRSLRTVASNLFDALISVDSSRCRFAIMEGFPDRGLGLAIMDRARKACSNKYFADRKGLDRLMKGAGLGN